MPGLGRYLGFDASHRAFGAPRVDLWFEAVGGPLDLSRVAGPAAPLAGPISGISRTLILLWRREVTMLPERSFVGGFFFRFADAGGDAATGSEAR